MYKIYVFIIAYLLLLDASLFYAPAQQVDSRSSLQAQLLLYIFLFTELNTWTKSQSDQLIYISCVCPDISCRWGLSPWLLLACCCQPSDKLGTANTLRFLLSRRSSKPDICFMQIEQLFEQHMGLCLSTSSTQSKSNLLHLDCIKDRKVLSQTPEHVIMYLCILFMFLTMTLCSFLFFRIHVNIYCRWIIELIRIRAQISFGNCLENSIQDAMWQQLSLPNTLTQTTELLGGWRFGAFSRSPSTKPRWHWCVMNTILMLHFKLL